MKIYFLLKLNIRKSHNKRFFNLKSERAQAQQEIFKPEIRKVATWEICGKIRIQNALLSEGLVINESGSRRGSCCKGQAAAVAEKRGTGHGAEASTACVVYQALNFLIQVRPSKFIFLKVM
jgi:hypothetical protein